ncbi:hypothetical protein ACIA58_18910 [Kribbella sp. NPDC051586]|uniref:hypothetical protein n=1 Tax=Kribbella sp. NPDC051586 TaxID=3364118 RepID=UPI0037B9094B
MAVPRPIRLILAAAVSRFRRGPKPGRPATPLGSQAAAQLADWSDAELYRVWRATGTELLRALGADRTATAAEAREHLLAEIERRYPAETAAWLASDAIFSGEGPRFLEAGS